MENKELNQFYEDICNLGRVLPNLAASVIYTDLNKLKNNPDRVQLILKKYFSSYEHEGHNCMSDDIKKIKRVVPNYPFIHINNDLLAVEDKDNRVQLVLKNYFDNQLKISKRSLEDEPETYPEKKFKSNDTLTELPSNILDEQVNSSQSCPSASETESYTLVSDDINLVELEKPENNDENSNITTEKEVNKNTEESPAFSRTNIQNPDIAIKTIEQIVEIKNDSGDQNVCNNIENINIVSVLSNLFPQHSPDVLNKICETFAVMPSDPLDECILNQMVQILLNYSVNEETFVQDITESSDKKIPVSACSSAQNNEIALNQEDEIKENENINLPVSSVNDKQLLECFENSLQECSTESYKIDELQDYLFFNSVVLDLSRSTENNTAPNNNICKQATFHPKMNAIPRLSNKDNTKRMKPSKPILKPSILQRNYSTLPPNLLNIGSKQQNNTYASSTVRENHFHRPPFKPILRPSILQRSCNASTSSTLNTGTNDILKNNTCSSFTNHKHSSPYSLDRTHCTTGTITTNSPCKCEEVRVRLNSNMTPVSNSFQISNEKKICEQIIELNFTTEVARDNSELHLNKKSQKSEQKKPAKTIIAAKSSATIQKPDLNILATSNSKLKDKNIKSLKSVTKNKTKSDQFTNVNCLPNPYCNSDSKMGKNVQHFNTKSKKPVQNYSGSSEKSITIFIQPTNTINISNTRQTESNTTKINNPTCKNSVQGLPLTADSLPSTSGLRCANSFDTSLKNSIRVRTDLYDMYFNGPNYESNNDIEKGNDDFFPVLCDPVPDYKILDTIVLQNDDEYNEIVKVEENSNDIEQPSTSKIQQSSELQTTHPFYFKLLEIFPDICPNYLKKFCNESSDQQTMDDMISVLLNGDYKRRDRAASPETNLDFEEQHKILQDLFPDADPSYLQHHCERLIDQPENFKLFVSSLIEHKGYPTKEEYLKKMKLSAQEKQYTTEFNVEKFLEVIPNPEEYFNDPERQVVSEKVFDDMDYAITFLKNTFCTTVVKDITTVFKNTNYSVIRSALKLEHLKNMKTKRRPYPVTSCKNIPLLQEIAYVKHKQEILAYIQKKELEKKIARERAKSSGLMKTCQCCYDDEIMPEDIETCESGQHIFCKDCIRKGCEVLIGDGKLEFPCLETCDSFFTLQVLQTVLTPKVFSKMAQRKQMQEVKSAGIEDLESCPFCDFAAIPAPGDKIFRCLNNDCMKESCRLCKEPSHIPLRCDEVEKDKDVKMRTYIENKMTEALLRKCYKCGLKFIKEDGCNKMTCSCGAMMCYICNKPVKDYRHFNGQGGDQFHLCPLYSDTHKLHMDAIKQSAESAMKELGVNNSNQLKIDPTVDLEKHYKRLAENNPAIPNIPMVFPNNLNIIPQ